MRLLKSASVALAILLILPTLSAQQTNPLTNADVIKMVKAGTPDATIANAIATASDTQFDLSSTGLQMLGQAGVSTSATGAWRCSSATCHATTVSVASLGRMTRRPGMARSDASCSMGW